MHCRYCTVGTWCVIDGTKPKNYNTEAAKATKAVVAGIKNGPGRDAGDVAPFFDVWDSSSNADSNEIQKIKEAQILDYVEAKVTYLG